MFTIHVEAGCFLGGSHVGRGMDLGQLKNLNQ
jgi:hypothetical protein